MFDLGSVPDDGATPAIYAGPYGELRFAVDRDSHVVVALLTNITNNDRIGKALAAAWPAIVRLFDQ